MTDDAEHMGLMPLIVDSVAHGLAIDGEALVFFSIDLVPMLQGSVEMDWIHTNQDIADDLLTWDDVTALGKTAAEAPAGIFAEPFGPIGDCPVSAHSTQAGPGRNGQNRGKSMPSALSSAGIGDFSKKGRQGLHLLSSEHHFGTSCAIRLLENSPA